MTWRWRSLHWSCIFINRWMANQATRRDYTCERKRKDEELSIISCTRDSFKICCLLASSGQVSLTRLMYSAAGNYAEEIHSTWYNSPLNEHEPLVSHSVAWWPHHNTMHTYTVPHSNNVRGKSLMHPFSSFSIPPILALMIGVVKFGDSMAQNLCPPM